MDEVEELIDRGVGGEVADVDGAACGVALGAHGGGEGGRGELLAALGVLRDLEVEGGHALLLVDTLA